MLRYRDGKFDDYTNKFDSAEVAVTQMCRGADGSAIFATILNGIVDYHDGKFTSVARSPHLPDFLVTSMVLGPDGAYWLGTRDLGVYHLRDGRVSEARDVLTARQINALLSAGAKQLWIGTDKGLLLWNGTELTQVGSDSSFRDRQILSLAQDGNGNIWVGTDHGMYRLDPKSNFLPKPENAEGDGPVTSIFADREGNIWAATPRGLQRLRDTIFTTYGVSDGLPGESNGPVHVDTDGRVWFAPLRGGLYWMKDGVVKPVRGLELDKDTAYSIAGGHGDLWVGRQLGGLTHLQDIEGKWHVVTYTKADGLAQNSVYTVRLSRDGAVWAGTLNAGVTRIKNGKFVTFNTENGLISNTIASILESRDGTMWFATPRGLSAFSNNHWLSYSGNDGLPSGDIDCLFEESSGRSMARRADWPPSARERYGFLAQVPDVLREPIFGLQEDANGLMWISTSNHVLMINRQRLLDPDFNDADIREFDLADGLLDTDGVKRDQAVVSGNSGRIWFSLSRGLSVVNPSQINDNSVPALPHIEAITADNSTANLAASIRIPPSPRRLTFEYTGLSLAVPGRIRFRYFLEGFDENHLAEAQKLTHTASWAWRLPDRKVVHLSEEWYRIYGFDPAEGTPIWEELLERIHPEDRLKWRRELEGAIVEKADYSHEFRILFPNGKVKWIHTVGHPALSKSGDLEGFVGSSTDITELKSAEQEREKLRQLEADLAHTNRVSTLGEMAASLAHEIKQPIAAAITSANSCVEWLAHEPPNLDRARAAAARIDKYGNRAAEIIDRIRSFYKKSPPQRELVDVNGIIHEMLTLLEGEAFRLSVAMRTDLSTELPKLMVDRVQLQQVFMNLMLNAIEAMKDSGGELTVKSQLQDGQLEFSVSDTGVGLPAEKMDQIFSAFFTTKPQGSGMGLAISRSIVESHGGQLWASANDGRGATFHFTLPTEVTEPTPLVFSTELDASRMI